MVSPTTRITCHEFWMPSSIHLRVWFEIDDTHALNLSLRIPLHPPISKEYHPAEGMENDTLLKFGWSFGYRHTSAMKPSFFGVNNVDTAQGLRLDVTTRPANNNNSLGPMHNPKCLSPVIITSVHISYIPPITIQFPFDVGLLGCHTRLNEFLCNNSWTCRCIFSYSFELIR